MVPSISQIAGVPSGPAEAKSRSVRAHQRIPCRAQVDVGIRKLQELDVAQVIGAIRRTRPQIGDLPKRAVGILRELILRSEPL